MPVEKPQAKKQLPWFIETPLIVLAVLILVGIFQNVVGRQYVVPSGSMEPTLHGCDNCSNDRIFAEKISLYGDNHPEPGDVIVFEGTESWNASYISPRSENGLIHGIQDVLSFVSLTPPDENTLVKRVIATGGQTISCQEGDPAVMVDGRPIDQSYVQTPSTYPVNPETGSEACGGPYFGPITVPEGNLFMMGDNRTNSLDSRYHMDDEYQGTIPEENVRGKVMFVFYPFNRLGGIDEPDIQAQ
ncbi:signal peptidase [Corynebacterium phocae]|uniref:Signal peptidase I n=1 Tax=Corynebacterium phocae TaxID=161895 RepID=A0A1L7D6Q6_9CORY|nr:signal peptidase [Corynebacterium phocae]KAA8725353.1 signal peptidase I [Corynebacterium phocae]